MSAVDEHVVCAERPRRAAVVGHPTLNGLDFAEVDAVDLFLLHVHFLNDLPPNAYGLEGEPERISVEGGTRIVGVRALGADRIDDRVLDVRVDRVGDFAYVLEIDEEQLDKRFRQSSSSPSGGCPVDVAPTLGDDVAAAGPAPALDYLAKDYASFRQLLLDLLPQLNPRFTERNPADLGIALVELLACGRSAFLLPGRRRERGLSGNGPQANLRAPPGAPRRLPGARGSQRVDLPARPRGRRRRRPAAPACGDRSRDARGRTARNQGQPPGVVVEAFRITAETLETDPALAGALVFETARDLECHEDNNEILVHAWGNEECCLAEGATQAWLFATPGGSSTAVRPALVPGDLLLEGASAARRPDLSPTPTRPADRWWSWSRWTRPRRTCSSPTPCSTASCSCATATRLCRSCGCAGGARTRSRPRSVSRGGTSNSGSSATSAARAATSSRPTTA